MLTFEPLTSRNKLNEVATCRLDQQARKSHLINIVHFPPSDGVASFNTRALVHPVNSRKPPHRCAMFSLCNAYGLGHLLLLARSFLVSGATVVTAADADWVNDEVCYTSVTRH